MEGPLRSESQSLPARVPSTLSDTTSDKQRSSGSTTIGKSESNPEAQHELATAIDELLDTVGTKFTTMSKDIMAQMNTMAARLDELESQARAAMEADKKRDSGAS